MTTEFDDRDADVEFLAAYGDKVHVPEPIGPGMTDVPGIARLAASTWLHGTEWSLMTSARVAGRLARATTDREEAQALVKDVGKTAHLVSDVTRALSAGAPLPVILAQIGDSFGELADPVLAPGQKFANQIHETGEQVLRRIPTLRERGNELLERSRDVWRTDSAHPAYGRILRSWRRTRRECSCCCCVADHSPASTYEPVVPWASSARPWSSPVSR